MELDETERNQKTFHILDQYSITTTDQQKSTREATEDSEMKKSGKVVLDEFRHGPIFKNGL